MVTEHLKPFVVVLMTTVYHGGLTFWTVNDPS
jgi:hypothetical protein